MNEATLEFINRNADADVRQLALRGSKDPEVDLTIALQQIQGRQTARKKIPTWAAIDGVVYPVHLSMEQCSSEQTARYKADLCRRLITSHLSPLIDLTGGFGVDFFFMSEAFDEAVYVERNAELCAIASHNFKVLGKSVACVNADGADYLHQLSHAALIFLDPARRDSHGDRTYGISDCTPDVLSLKEELLEKSDVVMLKLSPMLDWRKAVDDLGEAYVSEVHIVSVQNECKELLIVMQKDAPSLRLVCVNDDNIWEPYPSPLSFRQADSEFPWPSVPYCHDDIYEQAGAQVCPEGYPSGEPCRQELPPLCGRAAQETETCRWWQHLYFRHHKGRRSAFFADL